MAATDGGVGLEPVSLRGISMAASLLLVLAAAGCFRPPSFILEKTIPLPDSLGGMSGLGITYSPRDNCVLIGLTNGTLVIDATTGRKLAKVPEYGPGAAVYDPSTGQVYLSDSKPQGKAYAHSDSLRSELALAKMHSPLQIGSDSLADRIYCFLHGWSDSLVALDSRTLKVVDSFLVASAHNVFWTKAICCNSRMHRAYWVQTLDHDHLMVMDDATNQTVASVDVGQDASPLCYNSAANKVYVRSDYSAILVLDCGSNRIVATLPVNGMSDFMCCSARENRVYGFEPRDSALVVVDGSSDHIIARIRVPGKTYSLAYDSTRNCIYCCGQDWIAAIDSRTDKMLRLVRTNTLSHDARVVFCQQVGKLYYLQGDPFEAYVINCTDFSIEKRITLGYFIEGVVYGDGLNKVYCSNSSGDAVAAIDASDGEVRSTIQVGRYPWALCTNADGSRLYCANMGGSSVSVIDDRSDAVIASIGVVECPVGLCYSTRHDKLYCASESAISVIDSRADTVLKRIVLRTDLWPSICYDSVADRVFSISDDRVVAVDARSDSVVAETRTKTSLRGLVLDEVHEKLYCSAWDGTAIYVLDCRSMKVRGRAVSGVAAWLARFFPRPRVAYVTYEKGIAVINTDNDCIIGMVRPAKPVSISSVQPNQFACDSSRRRLFIANGSAVDVFRDH